MSAAASIALWARNLLEAVDPSWKVEAGVVLHPQNVEYWSMTIDPFGGGKRLEATLRALGRAANPRGWPSPTRKVGRLNVAKPYTPDLEAAFRLAAQLPGWRNRSKRLWIGRLSGSGNDRDAIFFASPSLLPGEARDSCFGRSLFACNDGVRRPTAGAAWCYYQHGYGVPLTTAIPANRAVVD
jgi:hypothetical protein